MAYPRTRSMNADLTEGMTDGKYKKVINDRGGAVDDATYRSRSDLYDRWFGIHEKPLKVTPDGLTLPTPNYVPTNTALPF